MIALKKGNCTKEGKKKETSNISVIMFWFKKMFLNKTEYLLPQGGRGTMFSLIQFVLFLIIF